MDHTITRRQAIAHMAAGALYARLPRQDQQTMIERSIPNTAERLPVIGLGTWQTFDVGTAAEERAPLRQVLSRFVELGGRVVDSSPMYGRSEQVVGDLAASLAIRDRLFVATKVWTRGQSEGRRQMEKSFAELRVRTMDLMQVHNLLDADVHLRTLRDWKQQGRIRYIGITHYTVGSYPDLQRSLRAGGIDFVQFNYSIATRQAEQSLLPLCRDLGVAVLINRPFESGAMFARVRGRPLPAWAAEIDCTSWAQIFLKYVVSHPAVTCAIPATSNPRHLEDNMGASFGRLPDAALRARMAGDWDRG